MKFRTEVNIPNAQQKIGLEDKIFSIGSCFSSEMSELLQKGQLQTLNNPFGTIFNPYSIGNAIEKLHHSEFYKEENLITYNEEFISIDHHSQFNTPYVHKTLEKINNNIERGNLFLQDTQWVIITYGTSFVYEFLPQNRYVANCHKIPQKFFRKHMLSSEEIERSIIKTIDLLNDICPQGVQILFSISPVRHIKDGVQENQWSKSRLINALHQAINGRENCHYLPIYEIMMDDLRDYRFYKEDMIHPSHQAVLYIFEKFGDSYFSNETMDFVEENFKIIQSLEHRPLDEKNPKYIAFRQKLEEKIALQQQKVKHRIF